MDHQHMVKLSLPEFIILKAFTVIRLLVRLSMLTLPAFLATRFLPFTLEKQSRRIHVTFKSSKNNLEICMYSNLELFLLFPWFWKKVLIFASKFILKSPIWTTDMSPKTIVATMVHIKIFSRKFMQSIPSSDLSGSNLKRDSHCPLKGHF